MSWNVFYIPLEVVIGVILDNNTDFAFEPRAAERITWTWGYFGGNSHTVCSFTGLIFQIFGRGKEAGERLKKRTSIQETFSVFNKAHFLVWSESAAADFNRTNNSIKKCL